MSFLDELVLNSNDSFEMKKKKVSEEEMKGRKDAENDYNKIKNELLQKARYGKYLQKDNKRIIQYDFFNPAIKDDFVKKSSLVEGKRGFFFSEKVYSFKEQYILDKSIHFNSYKDELKKIAIQDGVSVKIIGKTEFTNGKKRIEEAPDFSETLNGHSILNFEIYVECIVEFNSYVKEKNKQSANHSSSENRERVIKKKCFSIIEKMGFSGSYIEINNFDIDITTYKENIEFGISIKLLGERNVNLQNVEQDLYFLVESLGQVGGFMTKKLLEIYLRGKGFITELESDTDNIIVGRVYNKKNQYSIKFYCEESFSNISHENERNPLYELEYKVDKLKEETRDFDNMEGHMFEVFCGELLEKEGYENLEITKGSGDQGIDIICYKDNIKYGIQCKCYSSDVGNKAVQEVYAGKTYYQCHVGVVLTNRYFTKSAICLADKNGVVLWDRDKLLTMVNKHKRK